MEPHGDANSATLSSANDKLSNREDEQQLRKEVIEYLRDEQKLEEQETTNSGINAWVLVGAFSLIVWQVVPIDRTAFTWAAFDVFIRFAVISEVAHLAAHAFVTSGGDGRLRFQQWQSPGAPVVSAVITAWTLAPYALYTKYISHLTPATLILGIILVAISVVLFQGSRGRTGRFPAPRFKSQSTTENNIGSIGILVLAIGQIAIDGTVLIGTVPLLPTSQIQLVLLLFAGYWAVQLMLKKFLSSVVTGWAHRLERFLVLGIVSPKDALRQIEQRILGTRLSTFIDEFWDELEDAQKASQASVEEFEKAIAAVGTIPTDYAAERKARVQGPAEAALAKLKRVNALHQELTSFTERAVKSQRESPKKGVVGALEAIVARHRELFQTTQHLERRYRALLDSAGLATALGQLGSTKLK